MGAMAYRISRSFMMSEWRLVVDIDLDRQIDSAGDRKAAVSKRRHKRNIDIMRMRVLRCFTMEDADFCDVMPRSNGPRFTMSCRECNF